VARLLLSLRVDAPAPGGAAASEASKRLRERVYRRLGLKTWSVAWATLPLGSDPADRALDYLVAERRAGRLAIGSAHLAELLDEAEEPASDWCLLSTAQVSGSFSLWDDYPQYKPGGLPKGAHACNHAFVSARFVEVCQRAGLLGLEFLRCRNAGRKSAPDWFAALPESSLGNGVDHPWFDRERWVRHVRGDRNKRISAVDTGQHQFHQFWLRPAVVETELLLPRLLDLCPMRSAPDSGLYGLKLVMAPRYRGRAEPQGDFAYVPWGEDGPNAEGKMVRHRQLALRRRARDALTDAGLLKPRQFLRVRSIGALEPGTADLDTGRPSPGPMYAAEELARMRAQQA
jgi:hypothetical protein